MTGFRLRCGSEVLMVTVVVVALTTTAVSQQFGPFPLGTTIFVDVANTSGIEKGTETHPFNNIQEGINAARDGDTVGLASGLYAEIFGPNLTPNYVIDRLKNFSLVGMAPDKTIIRGDHSFSLIRVQNGASVLIKDLSIEEGGRLPNSEGGWIQIIGQIAPTSLVIENVVFQNNEAVNGGAIATSGDVQLDLINVLIANNLASNGGGGVILRGTNANVNATFINITVTNNRANFLTGGILVERATLNLVNSIVWNNSLTEVATFATPSESQLTVSFSDIGEVLFPGEGNISTDPHFIDPGVRNYRLQKSSPVIDSGTNTDAPMRDLEGNFRPIDGDGDGIPIVDIGAFEFSTQVFKVSIDIKPGSDPNSINPRSRGVIPVAILTTEDFDATTVDPLSVAFGPNGARETHNRGHIEDVDGDGNDDLVLHFRTQETGIQCGDTEAGLTGMTVDGQEIESSDAIRTVGCK